MTLPSTGSISMSQVNAELKKAATAKVSLNDIDVRKLAKVESGTISMSDLRGKKASENVENYNLLTGSWRTAGSDYNAQTAVYTVDLVIPKNIISGNIIVTISSGGGGGNISIPTMGQINAFRGSETKTYSKNNFNKQTLKCSITVHPESYTSGGGTHYKPNTVSANVVFTGEWEKE